MTFEEVLAANPRLTASGWAHDPARDDFDSYRISLVSGQAEFDACVAWLRANNIECTGSYSLKHKIEGAAGRYISNGACIAACLALAVPIRKFSGPNAVFFRSGKRRWDPLGGSDPNRAESASDREAMYAVVSKRSPGKAINEHFAKCDRLKVPHIIVHRGTTRSDVEWDCITLDPERHEHILSDRQLAETILCILDRFRGRRVTLLGGRWYGILRGIPIEQAQSVACEIWRAHAVSMKQGSTAHSPLETEEAR